MLGNDDSIENRALCFVDVQDMRLADCLIFYSNSECYVSYFVYKPMLMLQGPSSLLVSRLGY